VLFPGAHGDVAAAYPQPESGLSDCALLWMVEELRKLGMLFAEPLRYNREAGRERDFPSAMVDLPGTSCPLAPESSHGSQPGGVPAEAYAPPGAGSAWRAPRPVRADKTCWHTLLTARPSRRDRCLIARSNQAAWAADRRWRVPGRFGVPAVQCVEARNASLAARRIPAPTLIATTEALTVLCERLALEEFVTVDTEFMRERTYWPELCVVQLAGEHEVAVIDALAPDMDLAPLSGLLAERRVNEGVPRGAAGHRDFRAPLRRLPRAVRPQIAAMVAGFGEQSPKRSTKISMSCRAAWTLHHPPLGQKTAEGGKVHVGRQRVDYRDLVLPGELDDTKLRPIGFARA